MLKQFMQEARKQFLQGLNEVSEGKKKFDEFTSQFKYGELMDLIEWGELYGYIEGLSCGSSDIYGKVLIKKSSPKVTSDGKRYLEQLEDSLSKEPETLKGEGIGLDEVVKALTDKDEMLNEIRSLEADKVAIMKEKLERLREEEESTDIPWEALITLFHTIASLK